MVFRREIFRFSLVNWVDIFGACLLNWYFFGGWGILHWDRYFLFFWDWDF
jgi:hypothetical protein